MIKCVKYTPINKNTCQGIATVFVEKWGVEIAGLTLHQKDGRRWVNFPSRRYEDEGETKYYPYVRFIDSNHKEKFLELVKKAVDDHAMNSDNPQQEEIPF